MNPGEPGASAPEAQTLLRGLTPPARHRRDRRMWMQQLFARKSLELRGEFVGNVNRDYHVKTL